MFFILSKVLAFLVVPSNIVLCIGLLGLILLVTRFRRFGAGLMAACLVLVVVVGVLPIGAAMFWALENRFPAWKDDGRPVDGIIVLGGMIDPHMSAVRGGLSLGGEVERMTEAAVLARRYPAARIVFTGGNPSLLGDGPPEAAYAVQLFELLGVPEARVTLESRSRNTAENAAFSKDLVQPKPGERWLLVTSAAHMPRSMGVFRKAGFAVEPYPVDWHTLPDASLFRLSKRLLNGLGAIDAAAHEWVGLFAYWLSGRTSELFPGPAPAKS
jgi:uncharacterized SAM-binding protein YcdF (DUF218 family)